MTGRGLVEAEEKRSYGAVFMFVIGVLVACTVWAVWQDVFSRHLWKHYKTGFYETAIAMNMAEAEADAAKLAQDETYVALRNELDAVTASLETGEAASQIAAIEEELIQLETTQTETDFAYRIVKGEIEEAWYWLEHAQHQGESGVAERQALDALQAEKIERGAAYEAAKMAVAEAKARIEEIKSRKSEIEEELRPYHKVRDAVKLRMETVSMEVPVLGLVPAIPTIDQVVLKGFDRNNFENWVDRVERCQNCHVGIDKAGYEDLENPMKTHPDRKYYLGNHEVRKFGCTPCHGGQGAAINSLDQAHGHVQFWEDPLFAIEDRVQAKCGTCHLSSQGLKGAEVAARGEWLFQEMGCHGCHLMRGMEHLEKVGPSLAKISAKTSPEWLAAWVEDPQAFRPRTRMPNFMLERDEAEAVAAYLLDVSEDAGKAWLAAGDPDVSFDPNNADEVAEGKRLTETLGCLGCHGFAADEYASQVAIDKDTAPNLARIAEKTTGEWMYAWIRDPRRYSEHARMPSLRLSEEEASAITSYLLTLKQESGFPADETLRAKMSDADFIEAGASVVRKYGCPGCHVIPGMEAESRVSVELSAFNDKHIEELYFGDRVHGEHMVPKTWEDWTINKILDPRGYATARIEQAMPKFGLDPKDARAIVVYLSGRSDQLIGDAFLPDRTGAAARVKRGRELVARYNCQGCHSFDGKEGAIRAHYEDDMENAPPILVGEGAKLQDDWFFDFLMKPQKLRPWLHVRMPTFGFSSEDATAIVEYFSAVEGLEPDKIVLEAAEGEPNNPAFHSGVPEGAFDCRSCHVADPRGPAKTDFSISSVGLSDEEIREWAAEHLGLGLAVLDDAKDLDEVRQRLAAATN